MCGIVGLIGRLEYSSLRNIFDTIRHRGPDDEGIFYEGDVWLAHKRLSIVDLSSNGHQPMISNDGNFVLIFNGEIYNHKEIRKSLVDKGYCFKSTSDTETLLYGLIEYGTNILKRLNGIFTFALYNKEENTVIIGRDQFGIKPLYYYHKSGYFGFSSEIKALINLPGFDKEINHTALFYYLQMLYAPGEMTAFKQVKKLLPGHYIQYDVTKKTFIVEKYYRQDFTKEVNEKTEKQLIDELDNLLIKAVERQLMSDVPLGYFLSGGLDSSLIVALAKKIYPLKNMNCFTIATGEDMAKEGFSDDLTYARKVAKHLSVELDVIQAAENIEQFFDKMIWHLDEPQADPAPLHVYNIAAGARQKGIKVLLGGTGGDDLFSGYRRHQAVNLEKYLAYSPQWLLNTLEATSKKLSSSHPATRRIKKLFAEVSQEKDARLAGYFLWTSENTIAGLFSADSKQKIDGHIIPQAYLMDLLKQLPAHTADLDKMLFLEMQTFLPDHNLNYTDKMSMAASVEARVPYLDLDLVNFATTLPVEYKMKGNTTKYLLRKVAERYLPKDVIYRPKTGFGAPVRTWLKTSLNPMMQERLSESNINKKGIFNYKEVKALIDNTYTGKIDASYTIWSLMAIDSWIDQFTN
jgi:asparagine synthase (glutamine-hydrolysing)